MAKNICVEVNGIQYKKSSLSKRYCGCVGVARQGSSVKVTNVSTKQGLAEFSLEEWGTFVKGVKNGEFDTNIL